MALIRSGYNYMYILLSVSLSCLLLLVDQNTFGPGNEACTVAPQSPARVLVKPNRKPNTG